MKLTLRHLILLAAFGFFSSASTCDEPDLLDTSSASDSVTPPGRLVDDSSIAQQGPTTTNRPNTAKDANRDSASGDAGLGQSCESHASCEAGLECLAGECIERVQARISLSWNPTTDLDLHVITPSGEHLYYRNRDGQNGGRFEKDGCIDQRCEEEAVESVFWRTEPVEGTYEFYAINYDGKAAGSARFEFRNGTETQTFNATVPAQEGASSPSFAVTLGNTGSGKLQINSHEHESWVRGPDVNLTVKTETTDITSVSYHATSEDLGEAINGPNFSHEAHFTQFGETKVKAKGFDDNGSEVDNHEITLVVMNANNGLPNPGNGAVVSERLLAKRLMDSSGISLYPIQVSGRDDGADANSNMTAAANRQQATNSCYGNAPCGRTNLNRRMLQAMVNLHQVSGYTFRVTSMAGGSHSGGSQHYSGDAFDVDTINGRSVSGNRTLAHQFMQACRDQGATQVLGPGDSGHSSHVHCAW